MDLVAKSTPDGYTLALLADSMITINPHLYKEMQTDPSRTSRRLHRSYRINGCCRSTLPFRSRIQGIRRARAPSPPAARVCLGGQRQHPPAGHGDAQAAREHRPHTRALQGGTPAATATVAGEVAAMFSGTSSAPQIKAGRLRALAVTGSQRSALFPDLPTISEYYPGYEVTIWLGLFAATGTPGSRARQASRRGQQGARRD